MGGLCAKADVDFKSVLELEDNMRTVQVRAELCNRWGYYECVDNIKLLATELHNRGINMQLKCIPMPGGNGEFFLYRCDGEKEKVVFSNNAEKHKSQGAVIGFSIKPSNVGKIADLLM